MICKYFSQSVVGLFTLLTVSLQEQTFLCFVEVQFIRFFSFMGHAFGSISKNSFIPWRFSPVLLFLKCYSLVLASRSKTYTVPISCPCLFETLSDASHLVLCLLIYLISDFAPSVQNIFSCLSWEPPVRVLSHVFLELKRH